MNSPLGWALAAMAIAIGYVQWGWKGVVLGITVVVFWMLLQFSRALRAMRQAGSAPVGQVGSAVMLHAKLKHGMRLLEILPLAGSLGRKLSDTPETFEWADGSGARVRVELVGGRCTAFSLHRDGPDGAAPGPSPSP